MDSASRPKLLFLSIHLNITSLEAAKKVQCDPRMHSNMRLSWEKHLKSCKIIAFKAFHVVLSFYSSL